MQDLNQIGIKARAASRKLAVLSTADKNQALEAIAAGLKKNKDTVLEANKKDLAAADAKGISDALKDRLMLNEKRMQALADDARTVAALPDCVGEELEGRILPNGIRLSRRRIPIGVIGVIYEARPNVTIDISTLCLKTGNATILRGGSETLESNKALVAIIQQVLKDMGLPETAVQYIDNPDRKLVNELLRLDKYVDMIVPRGGAGLHQLCKENSTIPVITGGIGICHVYVDESADKARAVDIIENAKVQRPSVCNALDTLLVHEKIAGELLPVVAERLAQSGVELRADQKSYEILQSSGKDLKLKPAGDGDFDQEWLALIMGIRVVDGLDTAISHIQEHSTEHSDSILTNDWNNAKQFVDAVNSSAVYVNASTRFTDGGQFGLGAEVAVSTQKLHARGPMGLQELTTLKWIGIGDGHVRP